MRTGTPKAGGLGGLFHANTPERRVSSNDWPNSLNHVGSFGARGVVEVWKHREEERPQVPQSRRDEQGRQVAGPSEGRARSQDRCKARGAPVAHLSLCPQSIDHFLSLCIIITSPKEAGAQRPPAPENGPQSTNSIHNKQLPAKPPRPSKGNFGPLSLVNVNGE